MVEQRAVFSVRSAESPNGGANIPGASEDGRRLAEEIRATLRAKQADYTRGWRAKNGNERGKKLDRARHAAVRKLIEAHQYEYDTLYWQAKVDEGLVEDA